MKTLRGEVIILIGFVMVLLGAILPFLMVMRIIKSTFFLNFFSYSVSVVGLFLGLIGCAFLFRYHRWKNKDTSEPDATSSDHHKDW